ncbi:tetratricopeptide repeat protein [Helicobacter fennelliae]|uniref:tetratricopeptide repeat protein n=1 Tax=Helicobacter fennelliae TaxID=215 RepID=UPI000551CBA8|nr:tetratricopeptide repeat protein [Helicobacter fennelliae]
MYKLGMYQFKNFNFVAWLYGLICFMCVCLPHFVYALEISTTYGKEGGESFSVLTLKNDWEFACTDITDVYENSLSIECVIDRIPDRGFAGLENNFFSLSYKMIDGHFWLYIYPKYHQKLFGIKKDPRGDFEIDKAHPKKAKIWQVIGYKEHIPFLSQTQSKNGLDFPVKIQSAQTPFIPELNTNNSPLKMTKDKDFVVYSEIQKLMQEQDYARALSQINEAIATNPNSIFRRDLSYQRIIAMTHLNLSDQDPLINAALEWIKLFASDLDIPEVLYILANAYKKDDTQAEADYYYRRIMDEYPQSKYAPLAQMQLAKSYEAKNAPTHASLYFQKAYTEAKDLDSASEIAIEWALAEIKNKDIEDALELITKVLDAYPEFFLTYPDTQELIATLGKNNLFAEAAKIIDFMAKNSKDEAQQEEYMYALGAYYLEAKNIDLAHKANELYIQTYGDKSKYSEDVKKRDDKILFDVSGSDDEKITRYEYIRSTYPNTKQSQKATDLIAQILLKQQQYQKVLDLFQDSAQSPYKNKALNELAKEALGAHNCAQANTYLIRLDDFDLSAEQKLVAFDCLTQAGLHKNAREISKNMAKDTQDSRLKLEWLSRIAKNLYTLGDPKNASLASRDALNLAIDLKTKYDVAFDTFEILYTLRSKNEAKKIFTFLEQHFSQDERMLPVYAKMLEYANDDKDLTAIQIYAQHIIDMQKKFKTDQFTPYADFALASALSQSNKKELAIGVLKNIDSSKLDEENQQKVLYQIGNLYNEQSNTQEALTYFGYCLKITKQSDWRLLCKQASDLLAKENPESKTIESMSTESSNVESNQPKQQE